MKAITSITWGALILMLLCAFATPSPTTDIAGFRLLDGHDDDSDMMDHDDMDDEEEDEEVAGEDEEEDEESAEEEDEEAEEEDEEEVTAEEEEEDDNTLEAPEYEWIASYPLLHPSMENEIRIELSSTNEEYTWAWSVSPDHFTLSGANTSTISFTGVTEGEWAAGTEYTFSVTLTGVTSQQTYETQTRVYMANDLPVLAAEAYTIDPTTGTALDTDYTHTWTDATDSYPANGTLTYELVRVDGDEETLMSRASGLERFHLEGDADNSNLATFKLTVTDEGMASTSVTKTVTVNPLSDVSEDEKTNLISGKVDEIDLSAGTDDEKVQNLGLLNSLSQALEFSGDDSDGETAEETEAQIEAKAALTNTIIASIDDALTTDATDDVVDAVLGAAESVSANTAYLDDDGRDALLDLFEGASEREGGLTEDMATAAVSGLSNVLDSLDSGDEEDGTTVDNSETFAKVDTIVDNAFDAVFAAGNDARDVVIETPNIKATFKKTSKDEVEQVVAAGDNSVDVPAAAASGVADGSSVLVKFVAKTYNSYSASSEVTIDSGIIEFSLKAQDDSGDISEVAISGLTGDDRICMDISVDSVDDDTACKFWDTTAMEFSEEGLERTDNTETSVTCCSSHATDFALGEAEVDDEESDADDEETDDDTTSAAIATLSATALVALMF